MEEAQPINEYQQRYEGLVQITRLLLGAIRQMKKSTNGRYAGHKGPQYWATAVEAWIKNIQVVLDNKLPIDPPITKQLLIELEERVQLLRKLKGNQLEDLPVIVDDIAYRVRIMYQSMISLEGVRKNVIEKAHTNLIELIHARIKVLEMSISYPTALDTDISRSKNTARLEELRMLISEPNAGE